MIKTKLITLLVLTSILFFSVSLKNISTESKDVYLSDITESNIVNSAPSIQMYFYIKKYAAEFNIPEAYAFSLAYQETRYGGPMHLSYNHKQESYAGALGPMQIMPATGRYMLGRPISKNDLISDIATNVYISMKLLRHLHDRYSDWGLVFGAYNTGRPCVNQYSRNILNKEYIWKEVS
jgi:soluble lytic murein transglycosylase-like protein